MYNGVNKRKLKQHHGGFTMYFVDRSKIEETLKFFDTLLTEVTQSAYQSTLEKLGLERLAHMLVESIIDVGNMMIDGFIMRDPGSYEDIIDILVDEKVLPEDESDSYKEVIKLRIMLVRDYLSVDHDKLEQVLLKQKPVLEKFSERIIHYLDTELDVANAFSKE